MDLLYICIVTIFISFSVSAVDFVSEFCVSEQTHKSEVEEKCIDIFMNVTELKLKARQTFFEYSGDEATLIEFAQNFCPNRIKVVNCLSLRLNIPEECRNSKNYYTNLFNYRIAGVLVNFLCDNNAEGLLQIVPNDGAKNILLNESTDYCLIRLNNISTIEKTTNGYQLNPLYCDALIEVSECCSTADQINQNQNLPQLLSSFYAKVHAAVGCNDKEK